MSAFRPTGERAVHEGSIWRVVVAGFEAPDGSGFERDIVRSPGAVGVVPVVVGDDGRPSVVLVRQYRPALDRWLVEIPAGMRDVDGEPPEQTARRELAEEVGLDAGRLEHLVAFENSAGMTDAVTTVFLATDLSEVARDRHGPEEEHMELLRVPLDDAVRQVESGAITDAKTVIGLLLTKARLSGSGT